MAVEEAQDDDFSSRRGQELLEKKKPQTLLAKTGGQPRKRTQGEPVVRVLSLSSSPLRGKDGQEYAGPGDELG